MRRRPAFSFVEGLRYLRAALESIGVHLVIGFVMVFGLSHSNAREVHRPPVINATLVDLSQFKAERQSAEQDQQQRARQAAAERRRSERLTAQRQERERERKRLAAQDEQRQQQQVQRRREQAEEQRRADDLRRKREAVAEERRRLARETEAQQAQSQADEEQALMRELLAREEAGRADAARATKRQQWEGLVRQLVEQNWRKPPTTADEMACIVNIRLVPGGDVTDVALADCRIDTSTERSIKDAVMRSSPLPWQGFEDVAPKSFGFRFCAQEAVCDGS